jgi:hypothetical protein
LEFATEKLTSWKENLERKGLRVNLSKTKVMRCHVGSGLVVKEGKWPCGVCKKGVGRNSIQCSKCKKWIHKKCSKIKGKLKSDPQFQCATCVSEVFHDGMEAESLNLEMDKDCKVEKVDSFCYLGDMIGAGGGAEEASRTRVRCAWAKFNELGPILQKRGASLRVKGKIYRACVQRTMVYGSETWPVKVEDERRLERTERMMVRWMCGVSLKDRCKSDELRNRLGIEDIVDVVRKSRLRWFGHVERRGDNEWISACRKVEVVGGVGRGRKRKTWREAVDNDLKKNGLKKEWAKDKKKWESCICGKPSNPCTRGKKDVKR